MQMLRGSGGIVWENNGRGGEFGRNFRAASNADFSIARNWYADGGSAREGQTERERERERERDDAIENEKFSSSTRRVENVRRMPRWLVDLETLGSGVDRPDKRPRFYVGWSAVGRRCLEERAPHTFI